MQVRRGLNFLSVKSFLHELKLLSITNLGGNVPGAKALGDPACKADISLGGITAGVVRAELGSCICGFSAPITHV